MKKLISALKKYKLLDIRTDESEIHDGSLQKGITGLNGFLAEKP